ncbi:hypothetical protein AALD74_01650 [Lachnospiraceae bacterium 48-21]
MKRKILNIILSFFMVMLCCTLIARGAASLTVAKVKTEGLNRGSLVEEFDGEGSIKAKDKIYQSLPEGQKLVDILAEPGSAVHAGEGLLQFDLGYLEEKLNAQAQEIEKLRYRMEQQRLSGIPQARTPATAQAALSVDEAAKALDEARYNYQMAQNQYDETAARIPSGSEEEDVALNEELQRLEAEIDNAYASFTAAQRAYQTAEGTYQIAQQDEANTQANEAAAGEISQMAQNEMQVELTALQNEMDKTVRLKEANGVVTAQADGLFESAGAAEGSITAGTEQITLVVGNVEACGFIPDNKIGTVAAGDEIQVTVQGETKAQTLEIERIGQDEEGRYVWYAPLGGNAYRVGTGVAYRYSRKSENSYETLLPLTALRESGGSSYVLTAEMKPGILGASYTAVKVNVTVLEKDDYSVAVETNLSKDAKIITESSKYVKEGDRVRLSE